MELLILLWVFVGVWCHMSYCLRHKEWCGTPIWREPSTYFMFLIAAIVGPFMLTIDDDGTLRRRK
jgi:hypothetical protein